MPFVPAPGILEVFAQHTVNSVENLGWVLHYDAVDASWTPALMTEFAELFVSWWNTDMKPLVHTSTVFQRLRMRDISVANGIIADYATGLPLQGTATGQPASNNVSLSVKKNSGLAGKSNRGRIYQLGLTENQIVGNYVDSTYATALLAAWDDARMFSGVSVDYQMVIVSKYANNAPRAIASISTVASVTLADTQVDTRRDRM